MDKRDIPSRAQVIARELMEKHPERMVKVTTDLAARDPNWTEKAIVVQLNAISGELEKVIKQAMQEAFNAGAMAVADDLKGTQLQASQALAYTTAEKYRKHWLVVNDIVEKVCEP